MRRASEETVHAIRIPARRKALAALSSLALAPRPASAQEAYPGRPVRFIVAFPAGSATDQVARLVAQQFTRSTGQPVVVDNRGGASGFIACEAAAKSPPDGHTVLFTTGTTHAANPAQAKQATTTACTKLIDANCRTHMDYLANAKSPRSHGLTYFLTPLQAELRSRNGSPSGNGVVAFLLRL